MLLLGACRSASAGFLLFLRLLPVPCGRWRRVSCLPQIASETFPKAHRPFPVPARFSPDVEGTLQTLARETPLSILIQFCGKFYIDTREIPRRAERRRILGM